MRREQDTASTWWEPAAYPEGEPSLSAVSTLHSGGWRPAVMTLRDGTSAPRRYATEEVLEHATYSTVIVARRLSARIPADGPARESLPGTSVLLAQARLGPEHLSGARSRELDDVTGLIAAARDVASPHLLPITAAGRSSRGGLFVEHDLEGGTPLLSGLHDRGRPGVGTVLRIVADVSQGVAALHRAAITHGGARLSLVAASVDAASGPAFRLATCNLAALLRSPDVRTDELELAAPELRRGERPTPASDVYSLGALACTLLTRTVPSWPGDLDTVLRDVPGLPEDTPFRIALLELLREMLADDAGARLADATTLPDRIADVMRLRPELESSSWGAAAASLQPTTAAVHVPSVEFPMVIPASATALRPTWPGRRWLVGVVAATALLIGVNLLRTALPRVPGSASAPAVAFPEPQPRSPGPVAATPVPSAADRPAREAAVGAAGEAPTRAPTTRAAPGNPRRASTRPVPVASSPKAQPEPLLPAATPAPVIAVELPPVAAARAPDVPPPGTPSASAPPVPAPASAGAAGESSTVVAEVAPLVSAYELAVTSGNLTELRAIYPGMSPAESQAWEIFFRMTRDRRVHLALTDAARGDDQVAATIRGEYRYYNTSLRREEARPVAFRAVLRRAEQNSGGWVLVRQEPVAR